MKITVMKRMISLLLLAIMITTSVIPPSLSNIAFAEEDANYLEDDGEQTELPQMDEEVDDIDLDDEQIEEAQLEGIDVDEQVEEIQLEESQTDEDLVDEELVETQTPADEFIATNVENRSLAGGIYQTKLSFMKNEESLGFAHIIKLGLSDEVHMAAATENQNGTGQKLSDLVSDFEKDSNRTVLLAVNAEYDAGGIGSYKPLVLDGELLSENEGLFFGITKDGRPVIGDEMDFESYKDELELAIGGDAWLIQNSSHVDTDDKSLSGTVLGIDSNDQVVLLVLDGDMLSEISRVDLANILISFDVVSAIFLEDGGYPNLLARENQDADLVGLNKLKDDNELAGVALFAFAEEEEDEEEKEEEESAQKLEATIDSEEDSYLPFSVVEFSVSVIDESGESVEDLEEFNWSLENEELGTIDETGVFESNGVEGTLHVFYLDADDNTIGEASVEIKENLSISAMSASASGFKPPAGNFVVSVKNRNIVPGVVEREVIYNKQDGSNPVSNFLVDINLSENTKIMAVSKDYNKTGVQTVMDMANAAIQKTGRNVVAAINADLNWNGNGLSNGPLIIDGEVYSDLADNFFGITKDGEAIIGDANKYKEVKGNLEHAVRGMGWLVRDGAVTTTSKDLAPRTAVGIRADGSVFFHVVEGRVYPRSVGISLGDLAQIMRDYGAVMAMNMDGGGSTTYLAKREGEASLALRSIPSDGIERPSISSLMVYSVEGDGVFSHARVTSENDLYTPGSDVQFSATGVDNAGGAADLPSDLTWSLGTPELGTINELGLFTSNGTEGEVTVQLKDTSGAVVGSELIEIRIPDEIHFLNEEYSLGFDEVTDFGLRLTYQQREITFKDGDIIWDFNATMGSFDNNVFTSNSDESVDGLITAKINNSDVSKAIYVNVGKLPIAIFDFEEDNINEKWYGSGVNGGIANLSFVHRDSGEPVRFGNKALRIDFDFTDRSRQPGGAYAGISDTNYLLEEHGISMVLPGVPTGVGMWIYATEEAQGLWLRSGIGVNGTTAWTAFNLTPEKEGIDWIGWKYVELDLTQHQAPYTILPSQFIRLMTTVNSYGGSPVKPVGTVYVDHITVTYGTNPEDVESPVISTIKANDEEITDGFIIDGSDVTIETSFSDIEGKYATGIDYDNINIYVDGTNYKDSSNYVVDVTGNKAYLQRINLPDGVHEIKVVVLDKAGNETEERRYVSVDTGTNNKVYLEANSAPILGGEYVVELKADEIDKIQSAYLSLEVSENLSDFTIEENDGFEYVVEHLKTLRLLNIRATRAYDASVDNIVRIKFNIADNLSDNAVFFHRVNIGSYDYGYYDYWDDYLHGFSSVPQRIGVIAPLVISHDKILVGQPGTFRVTDSDDYPVADADIWEVKEDGNVSRGQTNEDGELTTDIYSSEPTQFTVFAIKDSDKSFELKGQSYGTTGGENGEPFNIMSNGLEDIAHSKNISWFSNAFADNQDALIQYALKVDYEKDGESSFKQEMGSTSQIEFDGSQTTTENYVVNVNNVNLTGLEDNSLYVYRIGNGAVWSELREFKTIHKSDGTRALILGDIQTSNYEGVEKDLASIAAKGLDYDFAVQIGDLVDSANLYENWNGVLGKISESFAGDLSMVHVLGNHEFYGDTTGDIAKNIFALNGGRELYYSSEYNDIYFAVINYVMDEDVLREALEWIVKDAQNSDAKWKVLLTHQPAYYSNPMGGNEIFNSILPAYADEAGFDFVISGHDHVYARTKPLTGGKPDEDGVVYLISGALGEKRYTAVNNPAFQFEIMNDEFTSMYMVLETTEDTMTMYAYDTNTGELLDYYTKTKVEPPHDHIYYVSGDEIYCSVGGERIPISEYVGFALTEDENLVYLVNGVKLTGLFVMGDDIYYFDETTGHAYTGNRTIWGLKTTFDEDGKYISGGTGFIERDNNTYYYENLNMTKGWKKIGGDDYYFHNVLGYMFRGVSDIYGRVYIFTDQGVLVKEAVKGFNTIEEGTFYLDSNNKVLHGWQEIDGATYYFSKSVHGYMRTGLTTVEGNPYRFAEDGKLLQLSGFVTNEGGTYYIDDNGKVLHGWHEIDGYKYYFSMATAGYMRTGVTKVDGVEYQFDSMGRLLENIPGKFVTDDKGTYYLDSSGKRVHGWQKIDGDTYYFSMATVGYMRTGLTTVDGKHYQFSADGKLLGSQLSGFVKTDDGTYYVDGNGKRVHGWQKIDGDTYYFSMATVGYMRTGRTTVDGKSYQFTADGKLIELSGFIKTSAGTYYVDKNGKVLHGWQKIDGHTYYFSMATAGYMRTGLTTVDGKPYRFAADGKLLQLSGFVTETGGTYYLNKNGKRLHGWQKIDGSTYYFSKSTAGYMRTGTTKIDGVSYRFDKTGKLISN